MDEFFHCICHCSSHRIVSAGVTILSNNRQNKVNTDYYEEDTFSFVFNGHNFHGFHCMWKSSEGMWR